MTLSSKLLVLLVVSIVLISVWYKYEVSMQPFLQPKYASPNVINTKKIHTTATVLNKFEKLRRIRDWLYDTLDGIQSQGNCACKKIVRCDFKWVTGFGHGMHRMVICAQIALALDRALVMDHRQWRHFGGLRNFTVNTLGKCAYLTEWSRNTTDRCSFNDRWCYVDAPLNTQINQTYKVLEVTFTHSWPVPKYMPGTLPPNMRRRLEAVGVERPFHWFCAQLLGYLLLRPNPEFEALIERETKMLDWRHPIVGMHVRQTDKITEAPYVNETKFVALAEEIFRKKFPHITTQRNVYVATDNNKVPGLLMKYSNNTWNIRRYQGTVAQNEINAERHRRKDGEYTTVATTLIDIYLLLKCDYKIITFSSNIGRLVWELQTAMLPYDEAHARVKSLQGGLSYLWWDYESKDIYRIAVCNTTEIIADDTNPKLSQQQNNNFLALAKGTLVAAPHKPTKVTLRNGTVVSCLRVHIKNSQTSGCAREQDFVHWPGQPPYKHDIEI